MKKILALSTDGQLLQFLTINLSWTGFAVDSTDKQEQLFAKIKTFNPSVLILDFLLNDDNAAAISHQIKLNPETCDLPIIILSDMVGTEQLAIKSGGFTVLQKPVEITDLVKTIAAAL